MTHFVINHLWQSSCFVLIAVLLAFLLRKNSPKVRYWVWLGASLKFLIPFAVLVSLGSIVPRPARHAVSGRAPVFPDAFVQVAEPFPPAPDATVQAHASLAWLPVVIGAVWALGFLAVVLVRCRSWLRVRATLRAGTPIDLPVAVRALITPGAEEPGIVGFVRPVLILPAQLTEQLSPRQLDAILTHELCHVRRRDNLFSAVHMAVEAIFWFHPLVWWVGSRMVNERELACDEEVLQMGCEPADYVQGILKVCCFYTESPLPCISGVTGADVKKRLRAILAGSAARELNAAKKAMLAAISLAALAVPILIGAVNAPVTVAQVSASGAIAPSNLAQATNPQAKSVPSEPAATPPSPVPTTPTPTPSTSAAAQDKTGVSSSLTLEVASIKPAAPDARGTFIQRRPGGGLRLTNMSLQEMIAIAWRVQSFQVSGGPAWLDSAHYDVEAKPESKSSQSKLPVMLRALLADQSELPVMLQALLADRFQLRIHTEAKEMPIYALVMAHKNGKPGPGLVESKEGDCQKIDPTKPPAPPQPGAPPPRVCGQLGMWKNRLNGIDHTISDITPTLSRALGRTVIDETGLNTHFDINVEWTADETQTFGPPSGVNRPAPADSTGPSMFTAFQEQLGLKFESKKAAVDIIIVEKAEKPSEN